MQRRFGKGTQMQSQDTVKQSQNTDPPDLRLEQLYHFLYIFCGYDIGEPLHKILAFSELLLQDEPPAKERAIDLNSIRLLAEDIAVITNSLRDAARLELGQDFHGGDPQYENVDLRPILMDCFAQAQKRIEHANSLLELEKHSRHIILAQNREPAEVKIDFPDDLPTVWAIPWVVQKAAHDITWFILQRHLKTQVSFDISCDDKHVSVGIGCAGFSTTNASKNFFEFESAATCFTFSGESLVLYLSWRALKAYGGEMYFHTQDRSQLGEPSKTTVTFTLPIHKSNISIA